MKDNLMQGIAKRPHTFPMVGTQQICVGCEQFTSVKWPCPFPGAFVLATFASVKEACANPHATVFSQGQNNHASSLQYAAIHALQIYILKAGSQQLLAIEWNQYSKWDTEQLFRATGLLPTIHCMCFSMHAKKAFNFKFWLSKNIKVVLGQKLIHV